jgi:hypothetical protein
MIVTEKRTKSGGAFIVYGEVGDRVAETFVEIEGEGIGFGVGGGGFSYHRR